MNDDERLRVKAKDLAWRLNEMVGQLPRGVQRLEIFDIVSADFCMKCGAHQDDELLLSRGERAVSDRTAQLSSLQDHVRKNPEDWDARLILADLLDDQGFRDLANGQRWQGLNQKRPLGRGRWFSLKLRQRLRGAQANQDVESDVPHDIWEAMPHGTWICGETGKSWGIDVHVTAEAALACALAALGIVAGREEVSAPIPAHFMPSV